SSDSTVPRSTNAIAIRHFKLNTSGVLVAALTGPEIVIEFLIVENDYSHSAQVTDKIGGGGWTRTNDLGIMSPSAPIEGEEDKTLGSAESSKVRKDPQQKRNKK